MNPNTLEQAQSTQHQCQSDAEICNKVYQAALKMVREIEEAHNQANQNC
jgi:hypothetical protein